ncbi:MAG: tetratricopeptide repeat protein [Alphaproteobacteria bacterium]|nr:tetratricopeptide repeat protein [Alphaproteobacteria bacterium]
MSEKYFAYFIIATMALMCLPLFVWRWRARLRYLQNLARINILKRQQKINNPVFFSTAVINQCVRYLYLKNFTAAKSALAALAGGRTEKAVELLMPQNPFLALLLKAHISTAEAYRQIKRQKKQWLLDRQYAVYLPILAQLTYDRQTALSAVTALDKSARRNKETNAYYNYIAAYMYLHEGDMLSGSQAASAALKYFQKKQYAAETAACHLALAEIYRISCVNDIAETMIDSAVKIYQTQKTPLFEAKAVVAKGMLMVFENRLQEAHELYAKALQMPITEQLRADIYNQTALLCLAQNDIKAAQKHITTAQKMQQALKNPHGTAFSLQLAAHIAFCRKQHNKTVELADKAAALYAKQHNFSACIECLYLTAEAQYKQKKYATAEKNLRKVLDLSRKHQNSFHTANAYSLLGLIYMQKGDLQRAKVLFQQSLHLEQSKQRCEGMVADYANLALIDELTDNTENAASNWEIALEYARQTGDEELQKLIEKHYNNRI